MGEHSSAFTGSNLILLIFIFLPKTCCFFSHLSDACQFRRQVYQACAAQTLLNAALLESTLLQLFFASQNLYPQVVPSNLLQPDLQKLESGSGSRRHGHPGILCSLHDEPARPRTSKPTGSTFKEF